MSNNYGTLIAASMLLTILVMFSATAEDHRDPEQYYTVDGQKIELQLVEGEMSIGLFPGETFPRTFTVNTAYGADAMTVSGLGDQILRVRTEKRSKLPTKQHIFADTTRQRSASPVPDKTTERYAQIERQDQMIADLEGNPAVAWVYPAYRSSATGTLLWLTPRVIAGLKPSLDIATVESLLPTEVRLLRPLAQADQVLLELVDPRSDDPIQVAIRLARDYDWILWAEPDFIQDWRKTVIPNDPLFANQWHLSNTGQSGGLIGADAVLPGAWDVETGHPSIVVAVIDDGVQTTHPDLPIFVNPGEIPGNGEDDDGNGYIDDVNGWDFIQNDNDPNPDLSGPGSHGTSVAGIAAAKGGNGVGVTGACQNCSILPVRISDADSFASSAVIGEAITYAGELADVLNNSWGGGASSNAITSAIQGVVDSSSGSPVFFANGNSATGYLSLGVPDLPAGTLTFTWTYRKDASLSAGFDTAWLDNVLFPDGTIEDFETCTTLPPGWSTSGDAGWFVVDDETRASSTRGGSCSIQAGDIDDDEFTTVSVTKTSASGGTLVYQAWPSSERSWLNGLPNGEGRLTNACWDSISLAVTQGGNKIGTYFDVCGTWSNQGNPLQDGVISYPSSLSETISVGSATNFDRRSDYSQWGPEIDFVCHSSGGSAGTTTTDVTGANGYDLSDYTSSFGGTSSASPLCAGIAALALSRNPNLTAAEVRQLMRDNSRQIGNVPYDSGGWNSQYGYGSVDAEGVVEGADGSDACQVSGMTIDDQQTYECSTVRVDDIEITASADVVFNAWERIIIEADFQVATNGTFAARIIDQPE